MSENEMIEVEVFVVVNSDGDYACGIDEESANESFEDSIGGGGQRRMVRVVLKVPQPTISTLTGIVPSENTQDALLTAE